MLNNENHRGKEEKMELMEQMEQKEKLEDVWSKSSVYEAHRRKHKINR